MSDADVLIAGAGPAGALTAILLARAGCRVRLLDRSTFPRHKLCGDTLNPGAIDILRRHGLAAPIEARALAIRGMVVTNANGVRVVGEYGSDVRGLSLLRRDLDWLLVRAGDCGWRRLRAWRRGPGRADRDCERSAARGRSCAPFNGWSGPFPACAPDDRRRRKAFAARIRSRVVATSSAAAAMGDWVVLQRCGWASRSR